MLTECRPFNAQRPGSRSGIFTRVSGMAVLPSADVARAPGVDCAPLVQQVTANVFTYLDGTAS